MRTLSSLLCKPAPNTAETTKLGAMRTQPCISQLLHTNETSEYLSNALHALLIHCLWLSAGPSATREIRDLTYWAPARGRQVKLPRAARRPRQGAPTTAPPARPIASGSAPATPISPFLSARQPWGAEGGRAVAAPFPPGSAARQRPRGSLSPRDAARA